MSMCMQEPISMQAIFPDGHFEHAKLRNSTKICKSEVQHESITHLIKTEQFTHKTALNAHTNTN